MWMDLLSHLTFTQMFHSDTYLATLLGVVLWTMCIEVMFYVIFPFLSKAFRKYPLLTYAIMVVISLVYINYYVLPYRDIRMFVNSFPSFLCVFANGMMSALIFVSLSKRIRRGDYSEILFTFLSIASLYIIYYLLTKDLALLMDNDLSMQWQLEKRYIISLIFGVFVISTALASKWYRIIFSNPIVKFIAAISMNIYIWHQWLSVWIKYDLRIPYWSGDTPPNQLDDKTWQTSYLLIIILVTFILAILLTYLLEKPAAKLILNVKTDNPILKMSMSVFVKFSICFFLGMQVLAAFIKNGIKLTIWPFGKKVIFGDIQSYFICVIIIAVISILVTGCITFKNRNNYLTRLCKENNE